MPTLFARRLVSVITGSLAVLPATTAATAQIPCGGYEVTGMIVGPWCGTQLAPILPYGINEAGDVAGYFICPILAEHAFLWTASSGLQTIPMPPGTTNSRALGIDGTQIVGYHVVSGDEFGNLAFLYDAETGEFTNLGTLPGGNWSEAHAVANGRIVGFWGNTVKGPSPLAFIWQDGEMIDISGDFGTTYSLANDINTNPDPQVTGWMGSLPLTDARAFIWQSGDLLELPPIPRGFTSEGERINSAAHVTGEGGVVLDDGETVVKRSFLWDGKQMTDLGTLPGTTFTRASDMDEQDRIVGVCHNQFFTDRTPFIWQNAAITALKDLIPPNASFTLQRARAINQAGQIIAQAYSGIFGTVTYLHPR